MSSRIDKAQELLSGKSEFKTQMTVEKELSKNQYNASNVGLHITVDRDENDFEVIKEIIQKNGFLPTNGDGVLLDGIIKGRSYGRWEIGIANKEGKLYHRWYGTLIFRAQWTPYPNWQFWYNSKDGSLSMSDNFRNCLNEIAEKFGAHIELRIIKNTRIKTRHTTVD